MVIDGVPISLSVLTDLDIDAEIGDSVKVEASLQPDGSLIAIEVERGKESGTERVSEPSKAEIEGTIEAVNLDGSVIVSLVVNGITVFIDADAEIKGNLVEGAEVKLEGFLQENGTLLAQELKARGRQAAARGIDREVEGLVEDILRDSDGNIIGIVVDRQTISAESLTRFEGLLEVGASVEVEGLEFDGQFVATKVEGEDDRGQSKAEEKAEVQAEREQERDEDKAEREQERDEDRADRERERDEDKADRERERDEDKADRERERDEDKAEREQERDEDRADRERERDEEDDGEVSSTGLDDDGANGDNSGDGSNEDSSVNSSNGDSLSNGSDEDSSDSETSDDDKDKDDDDDD